MKNKKLSKVDIDILRAISLYNKLHPGKDVPNDANLINEYINKVYDMNYWPEDK